MQQRKIIHIDMDAFFASVEQRDDPGLMGKPVVVGGDPGGRGVVAAASYEARAFGVHSAMPCRKALQLCPGATFVRPRFEVYKEVSGQIRSIFKRYTDLIEPLSLDEAYLDVTQDKQGLGSANVIAREIRAAIWKELRLRASAGISINKFVAKIASDIRKPNGQTFIGPSKVEAFMESLEVERFYGVGKVTASKMKGLGLHTGRDLKNCKKEDLVKWFGKHGLFLYDIVRGRDDRPVRPHRPVKSISVEETFQEDISDPVLLQEVVDRIALRLNERLRNKKCKARTISIKVRFPDFTTLHRSHSYRSGVDETEIIKTSTWSLLQGLTKEKEVSIRLIGITASRLLKEDVEENPDQQLRLF